MDNHEDILDALTAFGKSPNLQEIPSVLEQYLNCVAKNGETLFPWSQLKPLILRKMELVITELRRSLASENIPNRPNVENVRFDVMHARIIDSLHKFNGAPFTIQRLCELLIDPKRHYKRSDKFMRGLEKNVLVVSTVDPFGRKVVCESGNKPMLNGILDINGSYPPRDSALSVPLPPVPGWVTTSSASSASSRITATTSLPDSKDGAGSRESLNKDADVVPNGVSGGMAVSSSVFSDQDDPLAVHSEEVVEETVVTMDTGEVSSVVTDGGEAMVEGEAMEGELTDDRDASSFSSSSSSSSEELSTSSDSISPFGVVINSFNDEASLDENRPWAAFAQDTKHHGDATSRPSGGSQPVKEISDENQTSGATSSTSTEASSSLSSASSSLETQSSLLSTTTSSKAEEKTGNQDLLTQSTPEQTSWLPTDDSISTNEPVKSASNVLSLSEGAPNSVTEKASSTTTTPVTTTTTTNPTPDPTNSAPSSSPSPLSQSVPTYAQVVASSTDKTIHLTPYDSTDPVPCDSVAGLERLVGSMEQSLSPSPSSSASTAHNISSSSHPDITANINSSVTTSTASTPMTGSSQQALPSSSDCSSEGEPVNKRLRLSVEEEIEDGCISTSGDSYMEVEGVDSGHIEEHENKEASTTIHSSVEEVEGEVPAHQEGQEAEPNVTDMVETVNAGTTEDNNVSSDSTVPENEEWKDSNDEIGVVKSGNEAQGSTDGGCQDNLVISNVETPAVSTTNVEDQLSLQPN